MEHTHQRFTQNRFLLLGIALFVTTAAGCDMSSEDESHDTEKALAGCPSFAAEYTSCEKLDGVMPPFFSSVAIETSRDDFLFTTQTMQQGPIETHYIPDRTVRLGSDYHTLSDGTVLIDLPALESSYCEQGRLFRNEVTVLPDQTLAQEELTMSIDQDGALLFVIEVNGDMLLTASCVE